jgi:hypothetical protein
MQGAYEEDVTVEKLIRAWHDAVNNRDLTAARALVTDPVEVTGPRGTHTITAQAFADWIVASGIRLRPVSAHPVNDTTVVIEQEATWPDHADPEAAATPPTPAATLFRARGGALSTIRRFGSLPEALHAAGAEPRDPKS